MNDILEIIGGLIGILYVIGVAYFGFIWSVEWVETKGFVSYLFFGEVIVGLKAFLWPIFWLIG